MLISSKHKFIFIHNPKCAGTSIFRALIPYSNFLCRLANNQINYFSIKLFGESKWLSNFRYHIPAKDLIKIIGQEQWDQYFTFGVVRNPYDRVLSNYNYIKKTKYHHLNRVYDTFESFEDYVIRLDTLEWKDHQHYYLADNGKVSVQKLLRFENIEEDFNEVIGNLHLSKVKLKQHNRTKRKADYLSYYNSEMIHIVNKIYDDDFTIFGYDKVNC